jgi:CheY-like chemotaxis protein
MVKILIAEDEPDIRELVKLTLQFAGFEVIATANGAELLERAPQVMPDLILSDVRMPRMTGYEACRAIRQIPELDGIPVVFLSAKGQEDEVKAGLEAGGEAYILKPFAPDLLVRHVKELLEAKDQGAVQKANSATDHISQHRSSLLDAGSMHTTASQQMSSADGITRVTKPLNPAVLSGRPEEEEGSH